MKKQLTAKEYHEKILQLIASATLADHLGDLWDDLNKLAEDIGEADLVEDYDDISNKCAKRGITTIWGISLEEE